MINKCSLLRAPICYHMFILRIQCKISNEMYSVLEKTMILKSIDLFQQIPVTILTKIGQISEQINFKKDQKIFSMGDKGNSMFVIIKGKVDIVQNFLRT